MLKSRKKRPYFDGAGMQKPTELTAGDGFSKVRPDETFTCQAKEADTPRTDIRGSYEIASTLRQSGYDANM